MRKRKKNNGTPLLPSERKDSRHIELVSSAVLRNWGKKHTNSFLPNMALIAQSVTVNLDYEM